MNNNIGEEREKGIRDALKIIYILSTYDAGSEKEEFLTVQQIYDEMQKIPIINPGETSLQDVREVITTATERHLWFFLEKTSAQNGVPKSYLMKNSRFFMK